MKIEVELPDDVIARAALLAVRKLIRPAEGWSHAQNTIDGLLGDELRKLIEGQVRAEIRKIDVSSIAARIIADEAFPTVEAAIREAIKREARAAIKRAKIKPVE